MFTPEDKKLIRNLIDSYSVRELLRQIAAECEYRAVDSSNTKPRMLLYSFAGIALNVLIKGIEV